MAKKKVMLFIVEGPTDETSLSTVLNRIFSSATVKFQVIHGDILTRDFTSSDKIVQYLQKERYLPNRSSYRYGRCIHP